MFRKRYVIAAVALLGAAVIFWRQSQEKTEPVPQETVRPPASVPKQAAKPEAPPKPAPAAEPSAPKLTAPLRPAVRPSRLPNPPEIVKGVYFTSWSAGLGSRINYLLKLRNTTGLNTVVIDIKDYSGYVAYRADVPEAQRCGALRPVIRDIDGLVDRLHREGIYVIARLTVFQDPVYAAARPELAVHRKSLLGGEPKPPLTRETLWLDHKGLAWIDPAARGAWDYIAAIAAEAASHGFDELNFDYVRFPSDGDLKDMHFPAWDGKTPKREVLRAFFADLRKKLPGIPISADLFGLSTVNSDDLGIGQIIEDGYTGFDYVCPMVYPSHYAKKFLGFANPAEHPYEVVSYSMQRAVDRLEALNLPGKVKLRPWLQDFSLGAKYDPAMVKAQIQAVRDALGDRYAGYLLWSSSNRYTAEALE
ncbi:MAG: putative glycoside hydrolase [Rhodospirillales bacterium]